MFRRITKGHAKKPSISSGVCHTSSVIVNLATKPCEGSKGNLRRYSVLREGILSQEIKGQK